MCILFCITEYISASKYVSNIIEFCFQNLVHYRPPSQGSSPCPSLQNFPGAGPGPAQSYSNTMETQPENSEYMKSALCQIKEENSHNSA